MLPLAPQSPLATVDMGSVRTEIQKARDAKAQAGEDIPEPDRVQTVDEKLNQFLENVVQDEPNPTAEQPENQNPTMARTTKSRQSEPFSGNRKSQDGVGDPDRREPEGRPSVREELRQIREEQRKNPSVDPKDITPDLEHIPVPVKKRNEREDCIRFFHIALGLELLEVENGVVVLSYPEQHSVLDFRPR